MKQTEQILYRENWKQNGHYSNKYNNCFSTITFNSLIVL